jgi:hypothetical protein
MKPRNLLMGPGVFLLAFSCGTVPQERERFDIRFMTWGSFPFKRDVLEDAANQKILHAIRKEYKSGFEISAETSVPLDSVVQRIERLSQCDLVATGEAPSGKWLANVPIFDEKEILRAEKTSLKYARKEAEILKRALPDVKALYASLSLSKSFDWKEISWIVVGALISDFGVIDRIRFFPEYRDERLLPQLHPDGRRWSLTGYVNFDGIDFQERRWSFYQSYVKDPSAGFSEFGYYKPKEERRTPPNNPLRLALNDDGDIIFGVHARPSSFEDLQSRTSLSPAALKERIDGLCALDPPAILRSRDGRYASNIPIFTQSEFAKLLALMLLDITSLKLFLKSCFHP